MPRTASADDSISRWPPGTAGIVIDVVRIVDSYERAGWFLDAEVYRESVPMLLQSVCRAPISARDATLQHFRERRLGDPALLFARHQGRLTGDVERALTRERQFQIMQRAVVEARARCPFWIVPDPQFEGRQSERNKFALHLEGGGIGQLRLQQGEPVLGAGGNGRLLVGRGFGDHFSLLLGGELGGGALLKSSERGQFTISYFPAIPLVLRYRRVAWLYDVELAPVALFEAEDTNISYGARFGLGVGLGVLRFQDFLPWAGIAASYDHFFESRGRPAADFLRIGVRVGFRWLP